MISPSLRASVVLLMLLFLITPGLSAAEPKPGPVSSSGKIPAKAPKADAVVDTVAPDVEDPFAQRFDPDEVPTPGPKPADGAAAVAVPPLEGIGLGGTDAYAIIGGSVYYKGEEKNGIKLLEARRGEVDIFVNGAPMVLPLFPKEELKKANERREKKGGPGLSSQGQPVKTTPASFPEGGQDL